MARRRGRDEPPDILRAEQLKTLRQSLAHFSPEGVRQFYERAFEDCRLVYTRSAESEENTDTGTGLVSVMAMLADNPTLALSGMKKPRPKEAWTGAQRKEVPRTASYCRAMAMRTASSGETR